MFSVKPDMAQPIIITQIYKKLNAVAGVADTTNIKIIRRLGTNYSSTSFDIEKNFSPDRRFLNIPLDAAYEFKFPDADFTGVVL